MTADHGSRINKPTVFTPEDAIFDGDHVVGCRKHPDDKSNPFEEETVLSIRNTPDEQIVKCLPPNRGETHVIARRSY